MKTLDWHKETLTEDDMRRIDYYRFMLSEIVDELSEMSEETSIAAFYSTSCRFNAVNLHLDALHRQIMKRLYPDESVKE